MPKCVVHVDEYYCNIRQFLSFINGRILSFSLEFRKLSKFQIPDIDIGIDAKVCSSDYCEYYCNIIRKF